MKLMRKNPVKIDPARPINPPDEPVQPHENPASSNGAQKKPGRGVKMIVGIAAVVAVARSGSLLSTIHRAV